LKTEVRCLHAKSHLSSLLGFGFRSAKDFLVVRFFGTEHVEDDSRQLMSRSSDCLWFTELACYAPEKLSKEIFCMV